LLPLLETRTPGTPSEIAEIVRAAHAAGTPVYPLGGGTSLNYGLPAKAKGIGLATAGLNRVVDYPARDMTITVEAGITMRRLAETLAAEHQWLPVDAPQAGSATLGGVLATNWNGPRRFGQGPLRDFVIGISAVDGAATEFKAGGRVVKNVAGYDLCKLLVGSQGTLGIITQATLKVRPIPEASTFMFTRPRDWAAAEQLLATLLQSPVTPATVELLTGPAWDQDEALRVEDHSWNGRGAGVLLVGLEGTAEEVAWLTDRLHVQWLDAGGDVHLVAQPQVAPLWSRLTEFAAADPAALVLKANLLSSHVTAFIKTASDALGKACSIQAHAGSGIVLLRIAEPPADVARKIVSVFQPAAAAGQGNLVVSAWPQGFDLTRQVAWGGVRDDLAMMADVKRAFDPKEILNPGRFVFG
jgi:glycolate oxidase FAD binding subunit